jgi:hypothetical protein
MSEPEASIPIEELRRSNRRWKTLALGLGCLSLVLAGLLLMTGGIAWVTSIRLQHELDLTGQRR